MIVRTSFHASMGRKATAPLLLAICTAATALPTAWLIAHRPVATLAALPEAAHLHADCTLRLVGSSSIARWRGLGPAMTPWTVDNRGISGALLDQILAEFGADAGEERPGGVVLYGGDNDLHAGLPTATVIGQIGAIADRKARLFGSVPMFVLSLKPSPARWAERPRQRIVNDAIRRLAARRRDLVVVDVAPAFVADDHLLPLFDTDGVHLNADGYRIWTDALRTSLRARLPAAMLRRCGLPGEGA